MPVDVSHDAVCVCVCARALAPANTCACTCALLPPRRIERARMCLMIFAWSTLAHTQGLRWRNNSSYSRSDISRRPTFRFKSVLPTNSPHACRSCSIALHTILPEKSGASQPDQAIVPGTGKGALSMELDSMRRRACPFRKPGSIEAEQMSICPFRKPGWPPLRANHSLPPRLPFYSRKAGCDLLPCPFKRKAAAAMQRGCWCRVAPQSRCQVRIAYGWSRMGLRRRDRRQVSSSPT